MTSLYGSIALKQLLAAPLVYNVLQNILSGRRRRRALLTEVLGVPEKGRLLDIGCGTANVLAELPEAVEYVGFDASASYIEYARKKYTGRRAEFHQRLVERAELESLGRFDVVIATGCLHHLNDEAAIQLFELAREALVPGGVLMTLDPCFAPGQNRISRYLVSNDRGQYVRSIDRYPLLAQTHFDDVQAVHRNDLLRIPYDHCAMLCRTAES